MQTEHIMKKVPFSVMPQRIKMQGMYCVDIFWRGLDNSLRMYKKNYNLQLNPDFQRGHVWNEEQHIKYIEFCISGGITGKEIYLNYPGWMRDWNETSTMLCVDGLQRLTAAQKFMHNEFKVFNKYYVENIIRLDNFSCGFKFHINDLVDKKDILQWYLEMNTGGTPHTEKEIQRVKKLLEQENS